MLVAGIQGRETKKRKGESERRRRRVRDLVRAEAGCKQKLKRKKFCTTVFMFTCTNTHTCKSKAEYTNVCKDTKIQLKSKYTIDTHTLSDWACVCINVLWNNTQCNTNSLIHKPKYLGGKNQCGTFSKLTVLHNRWGSFTTRLYKILC